MNGGPDIYQTGVVEEDLEGGGRSQGSTLLVGDRVAKRLELRGLTWLIFELGLRYIGGSLL